jgi:hypothetical protein
MFDDDDDDTTTTTTTTTTTNFTKAILISLIFVEFKVI